MASAACRSESAAPATPSVDLPASGPISIALTGDTSFVTLDNVSSNALEIVRGATIGFTNLEVNLLDPARAHDAEIRQPPRWIFADAVESRPLRGAGIRRRVAGQQSRDGLRRRGAGVDDACAGRRRHRARGRGHGPRRRSRRGRSSVVAPRRVALVAVTASVSDQSRASASQQDIQGRPGVSPLVYDAAITVDATTYRTLAQSVEALHAGPPPGDRQLTMFGRQITKGEQTRVDFTLRAGDEQQRARGRSRGAPAGRARDRVGPQPRAVE